MEKNDLFKKRVPSKIINNPRKLMIYKKKINNSNALAGRIDFDFKFTFNEPIHNIVSVKLLKASLNVDRLHSLITGNGNSENGTSNSEATSFHYYILDINELNNVNSDNSNALLLDSTTSTDVNKLDNSFASLILDSNFDNDDSGSLSNYAHYYNTYEYNKNIKYFDPPLNTLKEFNIKLYPHNYNHIANRDNGAYLLLEFLIETTDKLTIYVDSD